LSPAGDKYLVVLDGARHMTFAGRVAGMADAINRPDSNVNLGDPSLDPRLGGGATIPIQQPRSQGMKRDLQLTERAIFNRVKYISTAFWDAYLHGNGKGKEFLEKLDARANIEMVKK